MSVIKTLNMLQTNTTYPKYGLADRALNFAINVAKFIDQLPYNKVLHEYCKQVIRSSASIGANMEEADGAVSHRDFINKFAIARKEARETNYWFRLMLGSGLVKANIDKLQSLIQEAREFVLILSSVINKVRKIDSDKKVPR